VTRILVIDDQLSTLDLLARLFKDEGYAVDAVPDGGTAREYLEKVDYDVVFTDLRLGYPYDGLEVLEMVKSLRPRAQVLIMTAFSSVQSSVLAMKAGAYDYITKPFNREEVLLLAARAAERAQLDERLRSLEDQVGQDGGELAGAAQIIGSSKKMVHLMRLVAQVARTDSTVLVTGESGTGKELIAEAIHQLSPRSARPFVPVNCGAIPENLQESEFFGHVQGAFTGAIRNKTGLFHQAGTGTLFLDEIGETSLSSQVKLLRFLQSGEVRKVGGNRSETVDVRLVAATNRDLLELIQQKGFREDLFYRLNIINIELPPLRERQGDVTELATYFLARRARKLANGVVGFSPEALRRMEEHSWPGNVRELENAIERAVTLTRGRVVEVGDLPAFPTSRRGNALRAPGAASGAASAAHEDDVVREPPVLSAEFAVGGAGAFPSLRDLEHQHIEQALLLFAGNRTRASAALGISKATLWRKIKSYGINL
jgi:DNA-binding NtrC family response regulator